MQASITADRFIDTAKHNQGGVKVTFNHAEEASSPGKKQTKGDVPVEGPCCWDIRTNVQHFVIPDSGLVIIILRKVIYFFPTDALDVFTQRWRSSQGKLIMNH